MSRWDNEFEAEEGDDENDDPEEDLLACPSCRKAVHEDTQQCPYCGDWITPVEPRRNWKRWGFVAAVILMITLMLLGIVL